MANERMPRGDEMIPRENVHRSFLKVHEDASKLN